MPTFLGVQDNPALPEAAATEQSLDQRRAQLVELMHSCGDLVLQICYHALNDAQAAQDLRQEIFVRAYEKLHQYRGEGPLRNWFLAMAKKRAIDATRTKNRWWRRFLSWEPKHETRAPTPPIEPIEDEDKLLRALQECVQALPAHQRMTVLLRYKQGLSCPKIAELGEETPAAVYERIARILPRLRKCVESKAVAL